MLSYRGRGRRPVRELQVLSKQDDLFTIEDNGMGRGGFAGLTLPRKLGPALPGLGYEQPTPTQGGAIPPLLAGRDLVGQAATGTGKTAAFALPVLQRILAEG